MREDMTQEQKDLLLKDLCSRLPYGVKSSTKVGGNIKISFMGEDTIIGEDGDSYDISFITPYLFPMSSMTEEQRKEYDSIIYHNVELHADRYYEVIDVDSFELLHDFYHKNHFDYRGLIPLGLAIDCTNLNIY